MLIDYRTQLSAEERKRLDTIKDALYAIEPRVQELVDDHRKNTRRWYPHEILPWGEGKDFIENPWSPEQSPLRPEIVLALETNLLTEDNLPYYHAHLERFLDHSGIWKEWNRQWTAEEAKHAEVIRDYLYLLRVIDPKRIDDERFAVMNVGFDRHFNDPIELFAYTSAQELATRVSHLRTGQKADEPICLKILNLISRDENFHFIFYRGVTKALLETVPELTLPGIMNQLYSFEMPGSGMSNFEFRQYTIANAGIYGVREHRDQVINPLLRFWEIDKIIVSNPEAQKAQERILRLEKVLTRMADAQDRRPKKTD